MQTVALQPIALTAARSAYVPELDTFRTLAILSVMCLHWLPENSLLNRLQGQTSNGVHLFFVLSGYLITSILMRCRLNVEQRSASPAHSLRQFYIRRFLRIFPVYYFVLAIGLIFHFQGIRAGFVWHASYLSNVYYYLRQQFDGPASLFWTLAVEEQFYLVWPLAILFLPKRAIFPFVLVVALLGTVCRVDALVHDSWFKILTPACMNFLAVGSLVAVTESPLCGTPQLRRRLLASFGILIVMLACCSMLLTLKLGFHAALSSFKIRAIDQPMMSMIYASLFAWAATGGTGAFRTVLRMPPLVYLGRISYGLYLYHLFVSATLTRCQHWFGPQLVNNFGIRFLATVAVASFSWFLFEKPLNDLKRYFPYRPLR